MRSWAMTVFFCAGVGLMPAQVAELAVSGGVSRFGKASLGSNVDQAGNTTNATVKDGFRLAVRFALNTYRFAGHEFGYAYNRSGVDLGDSSTVPMNIQQGFYDFLVYATPEGRMVHLAEATARTLERPAEELHLIRLAALLHDIGKIGIPAPILNKPGPLSEEEWAVMSRHPEIGRQVLVQAGGTFVLLSRIVGAHQECWDGRRTTSASM